MADETRNILLSGGLIPRRLFLTGGVCAAAASAVNAKLAGEKPDVRVPENENQDPLEKLASDYSGTLIAVDPRPWEYKVFRITRPGNPARKASDEKGVLYIYTIAGNDGSQKEFLFPEAPPIAANISEGVHLRPRLRPDVALGDSAIWRYIPLGKAPQNLADLVFLDGSYLEKGPNNQPNNQLSVVNVERAWRPGATASGYLLYARAINRAKR